MRLLLILGLLASAVSGQTVAEISGGTSNYLGDGGAVVLYGQQQELHVGMGVVQGHFVYNVDDRFIYRGWEVYLGDYQQMLQGGLVSLSAPVRGISLAKKKAHSELRVFGGAVGDLRSSPWFFGIDQSHIGGGVSYRRALSKSLTVGTVQAIAGKQKTSMEDVRWRTRHIDASGSAGWLQNNLQIVGSASAAFTHIGGNVSRSFLIFSPQPGAQNMLTTRLATNSASVYGQASIVSMNASVFQSSLSNGQNIGAGVRLGAVQVSLSDYASKSVYQGVTRKQSGQFLNVSERLTLHLNLNQYVSKNGNQINYNFGGGYSTNRWSAQVGYSILYFPALAQPYQKVLSCQLTFHIRGFSVNAGTLILPDGKTEWSVGGDTYQTARGIRLPTIPGATAQDARVLPSGNHTGKYLVRGVVVDQNGQPVEGAAVLVDKVLLYSDSTGHFQIHEHKRRHYSVMVALDQFMDSAKWRVQSCPPDADTETVVNIVLERI